VVLTDSLLNANNSLQLQAIASSTASRTLSTSFQPISRDFHATIHISSQGNIPQNQSNLVVESVWLLRLNKQKREKRRRKARKKGKESRQV
jgi:hypothetical protein